MGGASLGDTCGRKGKLGSPICSKQIILKGVDAPNKIWSFKRLAMLKCESKTSLHAAKYKLQLGSTLMFCSYHFKNG